MNFNTKKIQEFRKVVTQYYIGHKRLLPWRKTTDPYRILVSEVMLQQTQVSRVMQKYPVFISVFPDFFTLSQASNAEVLRVWQGMGYNRRALYLKKAAEIVVTKYNGILPRIPAQLDEFPGIGEATASSIAVFTYNIPLVFIETNIRRVFIHHFFRDREDIHDRELLPFIEKTMNRKNPREWYYALMDYGTHLGKTVTNPNRKSRHYAVQSSFEGSDRQLRGMILRLLLKESMAEGELRKEIPATTEKLQGILSQLINEGFIVIKGAKYYIS